MIMICTLSGENVISNKLLHKNEAHNLSLPPCDILFSH